MPYPITDEVIHALKTAPLPEPISLAREDIVALIEAREFVTAEMDGDEEDVRRELALVREALRVANARLEDANTRLDQAATWFEDYASRHSAKGDPEKADRNTHRAAYCRRLTA